MLAVAPDRLDGVPRAEGVTISAVFALREDADKFAARFNGE